MHERWFDFANRQSEQTTESKPAVSTRRYVAIKVCLLVASLVLIAGCTSQWVKMDPGERALLRNEPVIHVYHLPAPAPIIYTPGGAMNIAQLVHPAMGQLQAAGAAASLGAQWTAQYGIEDPTLVLQNHFLARVTTALELRDIEPSPTRITAETLSGVLAMHPTDLVFVFETLDSRASHYPYHWNRYWVSYAGIGSLYRGSDKQVLWSSLCGSNLKNDRSFWKDFSSAFVALHIPNHDNPTLDELRANNAALFKQLQHDLARVCADRLADEFLGIDRSPG